MSSRAATKRRPTGARSWQRAIRRPRRSCFAASGQSTCSSRIRRCGRTCGSTTTRRSRSASRWRTPGQLDALDDVEAVCELDPAVRRSGQDSLHWMRLRGPARRHPAAALGREDQCPAALADEGQAPLLVQGAVPELEAKVAQRRRQGSWLAHEAELRQPLVLDSLVGDDLDDVPRRIVEVEGTRVPRLELEHDLAGLAIRQRLGRRLEQVGEAAGRDEEGEVVERLALAGRELELSLAGAEAPVELPQLRDQLLRSLQANVDELH